MADVKISALSAIAAVAGEDLVAIIDDPSGTPASRKATITQMATFLNNSPTLVTPALGTVASGDISACTSTSMVMVTPALGTVASGDISACTSTSMVMVTPLLGTPTSGVISNCTSTSMVMVTPVLGTPTSGVLTNCTGLPLAGLTTAAKTEVLSFALSDNTTALTTGIKFTYYMPYAFTLTDIRASVLTAPTGAELIVDVHDAGTSVMTTHKLDIEVTEFHTKDATQQPVLTDTALANNAKIEFEVDQIGSTIAGAGLVVYLIGYQT